MYISQHCTGRAHRNSPTYMHPPTVGMVYPIPKYYSTGIYSPNCWQHISNTKIYFGKMYIPPTLRTETLQLTCIPHLAMKPGTAACIASQSWLHFSFLRARLLWVYIANVAWLMAIQLSAIKPDIPGYIEDQIYSQTHLAIQPGIAGYIGLLGVQLFRTSRSFKC